MITEDEFRSLSPSYDPGFFDASTEVAVLLGRMAVEEKYRMLRKLLGPDANGTLLDIGCGMGGFLLAGRRLGMDVYGVEPSLSHSRAAVEIFGLDVTNDYFESRNFSRVFDVVVLSHVIEHVLEPRTFLADVMKVLRPGGRLILITPNTGSLSAAVTGKYWSMFKPIDHVTMLTKPGVEAVTPPGSSIEVLRTSEWPGEFGAHLVSALRTVRDPARSNVHSTGVRGSARHASLSAIVKVTLAILSLPFYVAARLSDRQSCIYAVLRKDATD